MFFYFFYSTLFERKIIRFSFIFIRRFNFYDIPHNRFLLVDVPQTTKELQLYLNRKSSHKMLLFFIHNLIRCSFSLRRVYFLTKKILLGVSYQKKKNNKY